LRIENRQDNAATPIIVQTEGHSRIRLGQLSSACTPLSPYYPPDALEHKGCQQMIWVEVISATND
jgi:hypothetical protein